MIRIGVPAHDSARADADDVPAQALLFGQPIDLRLFGLAAHLDEAHPRSTLTDGVVDYEGRLRVDSDVAVLGRGVHGEPGDCPRYSSKRSGGRSRWRRRTLRPNSSSKLCIPMRKVTPSTSMMKRAPSLGSSGPSLA